MRVRCLLFALGTAWPAVACSCASYEILKACQVYQRSAVIFRGRVIDHNHDLAGAFSQKTLYRLRVLESFKGLSPGTKEVFINPASLTSCYREFELDRDYLVYAGDALPTPVAFSILGSRQPSSPVKAIPPAWMGLEQLPVYVVGFCNPTRTVEEDDADLVFLRSFAMGSPQRTGWIEGRAVQGFGLPFLITEFVAASDAVLTVTSPSGDRRTAAAQADGTFKIGPVPPGIYAISAKSSLLGDAKLGEPRVEVPSGGCAVANARFETNSTLRQGSKRGWQAVIRRPVGTR